MSREIAALKELMGFTANPDQLIFGSSQADASGGSGAEVIFRKRKFKATIAHAMTRNDYFSQWPLRHVAGQLSLFSLEV